MKNSFITSSSFDTLHKDVSHSYRRIGHALDNYGVDIPKELREALEGLYEAHSTVLDIIKIELNEIKAGE